MHRRHNAFVDSQGIALEDREEEIHLLYRQCEKYEDIIDEAEYVTYEQSVDLKVQYKEERDWGAINDAGLYGQLDKVCSSKSVILGNGSR